MLAKIDLPSRPRPQPVSEYIISVPTQHTEAVEVFTRSLGREEPPPTFVPPDTTDIMVRSTSCALSTMFLSIVPRTAPGGTLPADTISTKHWRCRPRRIPIHHINASGKYYLYVRSLHVVGRTNSSILRCPSFRWYSMHDRNCGQIVPALHVRY